MIRFFLLAAGLFFCRDVRAQINFPSDIAERWEPDRNILYQNDYVQVITGDIPLIISVPHGGFMRPENIPKRSCKYPEEGRAVTVTDSKTIKTARAIEEAFIKKYNKRPFIVISNLARTQVDQNRPVKLATCGNALAEQAWKDFHKAIDTAIALTTEKFGYALYIDLHGHGHKNQRLELGYALNGKKLRTAFKKEDKRDIYGASSSMKNYLRLNPEEKFENLLWGKTAFGSLMYKAGIPATPSMQDPYPKKGEKFFSGGYNTRRYTSEKYPRVFGWQIESNYKGVRDTDKNRMIFAKAFVKAYIKFVKKHLQR